MLVRRERPSAGVLSFANSGVGRGPHHRLAKNQPAAFLRNTLPFFRSRSGGGGVPPASAAQPAFFSPDPRNWSLARNWGFLKQDPGNNSIPTALCRERLSTLEAEVCFFHPCPASLPAPQNNQMTNAILMQKSYFNISLNISYISTYL